MRDDRNDTYINGVVEASDDMFNTEAVNTYRCIYRLLKGGSFINQSSGKNALQTYIERYDPLHRCVQMLLLAAGETVSNRRKTTIMKGYKYQDKFSLKHLSREAVRKQMITSHPHDNLFHAVPKLGIPQNLESYLVYDVFLNDDKSSDAEFHEKMIQYCNEDDEEEDSNADADMNDDDMVHDLFHDMFHMFRMLHDDNDDDDMNDDDSDNEDMIDDDIDDDDDDDSDDDDSDD